jgi:hypothetical protein
MSEKKPRQSQLRDIQAAAAILDENGSASAPIRTTLSRRHVMTKFKPARRGGEPMAGEHAILIQGRE